MHSRNLFSFVVAASTLLASLPLASGHVSVQGPGFADKSQVLTFPNSHGCAGADTFRVEIHIPQEVTSVRAMPNAFGDAEVVTNDQLLPTSVVWEKSEVKAADDQYYEFKLRIRVPDAPFTILHFPATQVCRDAEGVETTVEWTAVPPAEGEPAPKLVILPARAPGWNKYQVTNAIDDLPTYFGDAQIVWAGAAAYSANPDTMQRIQAEEDVAELSAIAAGSEIWVKY